MKGNDVVEGESINDNPPINGMLFPNGKVFSVNNRKKYCRVHWTTHGKKKTEIKKGIIEVEKIN